MRLDELNVTRSLRCLSPYLHLRQDWIGSEFLYYTVYSSEGIAPGEPWLRAVSSRIDDGASMHMIEALVENEGDLWDSWQRVKQQNWELKRRRREESLQNYEDAIREHQASTGKLRRYFHDGDKYIY